LTEGYVDDVFTFSGRLIPPGEGYLVTLFRNGADVGSALTDRLGYYTINWTCDVVGAHTFHSETTV